jgi:hypothetical protein
MFLCIYTLYTIKMYWANKEAADAATSAATTAADTLKASVSASHLDLRPLVVLSEMHLLEEPRAGRPLKAIGVLINVGKTPAVNTYVRSNSTLWTNNAPQPIDKGMRIASESHHTSEIIAPGGIGNAHFYPDPHILNAEQLAAYRSGTTRIMFVARVDYADVFSGSTDHWTKICVSFAAGHSLNEFEWCPHENEIDTEKNR